MFIIINIINKNNYIYYLIKYNYKNIFYIKFNKIKKI